jgi:hypothetical protein
LGGSPSDLKNKALLTREQHIEAVNFWNKFIKEQQKNKACTVLEATKRRTGSAGVSPNVIYFLKVEARRAGTKG